MTGIGCIKVKSQPLADTVIWHCSTL